MAATNKNDSVEKKLDNLLRAIQDQFILQSLLAGISAVDVRKMMKIDRLRVSNISRYLPKGGKRG
jgi:hypothetical protein